jgi:putative NADH-flavin reductase
VLFLRPLSHAIIAMVLAIVSLRRVTGQAPENVQHLKRGGHATGRHLYSLFGTFAPAASHHFLSRQYFAVAKGHLRSQVLAQEDQQSARETMSEIDCHVPSVPRSYSCNSRFYRRWLIKLLVIGATGGLGRRLTEQALEVGHAVTAFVRRAEALAATNKKLTVTTGDLFDPASVDTAVTSHDAVLGAVAPKLRLRQHTTVFSRGVANLRAAMEGHGVRRLIWVTSAGIVPADLAATGFFFSQIFKLLFLSGVYADCALSEQELRASCLDWICVHPTRLTDGPHTAKYRVDPWHTPSKGKGISRADVADFMLKQLSSDEYVRKTPVLAY